MTNASTILHDFGDDETVARAIRAASAEMRAMVTKLLETHESADVTIAAWIVNIEIIERQMKHYGVPDVMVRTTQHLLREQHKMIAYLIDAQEDKVKPIAQGIREHMAVLMAEIDEAIDKRQEKN